LKIIIFLYRALTIKKGNDNMNEIQKNLEVRNLFERTYSKEELLNKSIPFKKKNVEIKEATLPEEDIEAATNKTISNIEEVMNDFVKSLKLEIQKNIKNCYHG